MKYLKFFFVFFFSFSLNAKTLKLPEVISEYVCNTKFIMGATILETRTFQGKNKKRIDTIIQNVPQSVIIDYGKQTATWVWVKTSSYLSVPLKKENQENLKKATMIVISSAIKKNNKELNIGIVEKGSEVGAHILSGAVLETKVLDELIPDWKSKDSPLKTEAIKDNFLLLTKNKSFKLPTPPQMKNDGNYIISLGNFCRWLAKQAEELGVNIFPGFAASEILYDEKTKKVIGIRIGDQGIDKNGKQLENFQQGYDLLAKQTIFAEGCHGSLTKKLII